jgi:hypothetical protein
MAGIGARVGVERRPYTAPVANQSRQIPRAKPSFPSPSHHPQFVARLKNDPGFAAWFQPLEESLADLLTGPCWSGEAPFPCHRWSRILLLQQLLVEAFDLLDPRCLRIMPSRRMRLVPVAYKPLPNLEAYQARLLLLSGGSGSSSKYEALNNLRDPLAVAQRGGAVAPGAPVPWLPWANNDSAAAAGSPKPGGSPGRTGDGSPSVSFDNLAAALANGIKPNGSSNNNNNGTNADRGASPSSSSPLGLMASKLPPAGDDTAILPLSSVQQQMKQLHAQGGAGGRLDGEALLMDVIGAPMIQRLQQAQLLGQQVGAAQQQQQQLHAKEDNVEHADTGGSSGTGGGSDSNGEASGGGSTRRRWRSSPEE